MRRALWAWTLAQAATAQFQFLVPDSDKADFAERWAIGSILNISWTAGWHGVGDALDKADLWVTWYRSDAYVQLLLEGVTFDKAGALDWKVNISNDVVNMDNEFVLRLKPHSDPPMYTSTENESPSRGFRIIASADTSLTTSTGITTTFSTPTTSFSTSATTMSSAAATELSATQTSTSAAITKEGSALNIGAVTGGLVGGVVFLAMLGIIVYLLRRVKEDSKRIDEIRTLGSSASPYLYYGREADVAELQDREMIAEADGGRKTHELEGMKSFSGR